MDKLKETHNEKDSSLLMLEKRVALLERQVALLMQGRSRILTDRKPEQNPDCRYRLMGRNID